MVFESIVADLLNRFLGDYVENLDQSQLKIGIWGGDVVLQNLKVKQSALDELDLPVKTLYGHLGKLVLKIPWKNLYSAPVEASIERLYLLAVPNKDIKYDPLKEEKWAQDAKQAELQRIENAKKQEKEKDQPKADDSFVEKLATQVIKNVQVKINDIHIRYEDKVTNPDRPFAFGVTLHNLSVQTTDENWLPCIVQDTVNMIHKVLALEGLAVYWNFTSTFMSSMSEDQMSELFAAGICSKDNVPSDYVYVLGPINSSAKLKLNPKPEADGSNYEIPKVNLNLGMEKLAIGLSKLQYRGLIDLLESFEEMTLAAPYRKYRPDLTSYHGHYKEWWHFAYTCILEEDVRRRRRNWDWNHIREHRQWCREYAELYQSKLTTRKTSTDVQTGLDELEKKLDVFCIVLMRQKIEMEVEREDRKQQEMKQKAGWFGGWFGGGAARKESEDLSAAVIAKKFEEAMTPEEKAKMYKAIGYQENAAPTLYPKTFVELSLNFKLGCLEMTIRDDEYSDPQVLHIEFTGVATSIQRRPSAEALKVTAGVTELMVYGLRQGSLIPQLVTSKDEGDGILLNVLFETNPLDEKCDHRVHVSSRPLKVVYDAHTINKVIDVFKAPQQVALNQLQAAATSKLADFKQMSAYGLQYAIEQHSVLDLNVDLCSTYILMPRGGVYTGSEDLLIVNLGRFKMTSVGRDDKKTTNVRALVSQGTAEAEVLKTMMSHSYDKFIIQLQEMQVLLSLDGENWRETLTQTEPSDLHILRPTSLTVRLEKCLIADDPRLPKIKIAGSLPNVEVNISDMRLVNIITLLTSIPMPEDELPPLQSLDAASRSSSLSLLSKQAVADLSRTGIAAKPKPLQEKDLVQATELEAKFEMGDLVLMVSTAEITSQKLMEFHLLRLELELVQQTFDMTVLVRLGGVSLTHFGLHQEVKLLNTPMAAGRNEYLFTLRFVRVDKKSPELTSKHGSVLQLLDVNVTSVDVLLHQEALVNIMEFVHQLMARLEDVEALQSSGRTQGLSIKPTLEAIMEEDGAVAAVTKPRRKRGQAVVEVIDMKLQATMKDLKIRLENRKHTVADLVIAGGDARVIIKKSYTEVVASLRDLTVMNPASDTPHNKILSVLGEEALSIQLVLYNLDDDASPDSVDMSVKADMACIRVVYLNIFVSAVLEFLSSFQAAKDTVMEKAAEAAEAAKQNVQDAYTKAVKISLAIKLKAPIIVVPVSSKSVEALIMDFGFLNIKNNFQILSTKNELGHSAVLDEIQLGLQNVKLSRVKLNYDSEAEVSSECLILQPITFGLVVQRNLSASWYKNIPDIEMSGRLETICVSLSQEDLKVIFRTLKENLGEGVENVPQAKRSNDLGFKKSLADRPSTLEGLQKITVEAVESAPEVIRSPEAVNTFMKFTFTMDSLILDLYTGGSKELKSPVSPQRTLDTGLARFSMHVLSVKGRMLSNGSISTSVLLVDCLLDDTRAGRQNKLTRLMQRNTEVDASVTRTQHSDSCRGDAPFRSMIDITYQQKGPDMFVDVRVFGFHLILNLDYLLKVADFFMNALPEASPAEPTSSASNPHIKARKSRSTIKSQSNTSQASRAPSRVPGEQEPTSMMTVNVRIEKPDIILVESMDDIDTNAIILNTELVFKLRMTDTQQVMDGSVKDLQLYSCCFNPSKRNETMAQILRPCSISLAGSTPQGRGLHLDICVTDIRLSVTPWTIGLLTNIQSALITPEAETTVEEQEEKDYTEIWTPRTFSETEYWFLRTELGQEAELVEELLETPQLPSDQMCIIAAPSIVVTVEAGVGTQTFPMILLELGFQGTVGEWSTQLYVDSSMTLQVAYYNSSLALWEPLVEPVESLTKEKQVVHTPWELRAVVQMNKQEPIGTPISGAESEIEEIPFQPPAMSIDVSSKENLELTMTKTCLEVLTNLGQAFQTAVKQGIKKHSDPGAPYIVQNDTGLSLTLKLKKGPFLLVGGVEGENYNQVLLGTGAKVGLCLKATQETSSTKQQLVLSGQRQVNDKFISIRVNERNQDLELPVVRADKRFFDLHHRSECNDPWGIVSDVRVQDGGTIITLRSIIQVHNHFHEPIDVYYMTKRGNEVECVGTVESGKVLNLPLYAVYTPTNELFFSVKGYTVSVVPFVWKDLQNQLTTSKLLQCNPKSKDQLEPFFIKIVGEMEQIFFEDTSRHTMASTCYNLHLRPAVILKNFLPVALVCCVQGIATERGLKAGEQMQMPTAEPGKTTIVLRIPDYLEKEWSCKHEIQNNPPELTVWTFDSYDSVQKVSMDLGMHTVIKNGSIIMSLYCPFWMLNKTGLMLSYRQSDESANILYHPEDFKGPVLFSFKAKSFFGKKKACIKIEDGEWSDKFSLDVAGSSGLINCKANGMVYQVGVSIQLTYSTLTKQVTFTPFYVLVNNTKTTIECQEADRPGDPWLKVLPEECAAFWPRSLDGDHQLRVRISGTQEFSAPFSYNTVHTTLLRLDNKYGGLNVDAQMTEGGVYLTFTPYAPGLAPALIINHTGHSLRFWEKGSSLIRTLSSHESVMFAWEEPSGPRQIVWNSGKKKEITEELRKDGIGEFPLNEEKTYWVSFLDGMQRVLLFTPEMAVARDAQAAGEMELLDQEITLSVHGVGLSLVNNLERTELLYIGIASSGVIWETRKLNSKRFRPLSIKDCKLVEQAYQLYIAELDIGGSPPSRLQLDPKLEVDFEQEEMLRPTRRQLRRTFQTGLWVQMKTSQHQLQLHAKVNRLQIDNQLMDCVFPVVLAPVPPPKSVAADNALKPFAELSVVQRIMQHTTVHQYKYFKVLIQEFHVKVDIGFVNALIAFFEADETTEEQEAAQFEEDLTLVDKPLLATVSLQSSQEQKNFYDLLHFSPLKIHLSFSLSSSGSSGSHKGGQEAPQFLTVLLQSLGVTLTDVQDVVFKLAYFERQYTFLTQRQLISEATMHYVGQAVKQLYVLVLGLDVIGNPYGLVLGFTQGVEDLFYEPFQGAIQGPGEFAEGLVLGMRSLFGHTVGGAAGAMSRITGAMGKGLAALTFDKDYQRKRREAQSQRPANVQMGLAQSGKGLVMGVVDGVSGVILKPISGAREEGVEGFFKGVGKGVMGLVTRPTAGVIDFASGSLDAVKRATEMNEEVLRLRPPRYFQPDGLVRPYVHAEAEGNKLLKELEKGRYASTDIYVYHMAIIPPAKDILLLTDKRIMYVVRNEIFGGWQVEWEHTWSSISAPPHLVEKGIFITTGESRRKLMGLFTSGDNGKVVLIKDPEVKQMLLEKMEHLMRQ